MNRTATPIRIALLLALFVFGSSLAEAQRGRSSTSRSSSSNSTSRSTAQTSRPSSSSSTTSRPSTGSRSSSRPTSRTTSSRPTTTPTRSTSSVPTRTAPTGSSRTRSTTSSSSPSNSRTSWGTRYDSSSNNTGSGSRLYYPGESSSSNSRDLGSYRGTNSDFGSDLEYAPVSESVRRGLDWYQGRGDSGGDSLAPSADSGSDTFGSDSGTYDLGNVQRAPSSRFPRPFLAPQPDRGQSIGQRRSSGARVPSADSSSSVRSILDRYRGGSDRGPSPADLTDIVQRNQVAARAQSESDSPYAAGPFGRLSSSWLQSNRALPNSRDAQARERDGASNSGTQGEGNSRNAGDPSLRGNGRDATGSGSDPVSNVDKREGRSAALPTGAGRSAGRTDTRGDQNKRASENSSRDKNLGDADGIYVLGPASARGGLPKADRSQLTPGSKLDTDTVFPGGGDDDGGKITPPAGGGTGDHNGAADHGWHNDYDHNYSHHYNHFNHYYPYWSNYCGYSFGYYGYHWNYIWGTGLYWAYSWPLYYRPYLDGYGGYSHTTVIVEQQEVYVSDYEPYYESTGRPARDVRTPEDMQAQSAAAERYLGLGDRAFREGRYGDAVHFYAKAIEYAPEEGVLYLVLSDALFATGDYHYGAYALRRALEYSPHLFDSQIDKRSFYGNPAAFDRQLAVLERYLRDLPFDGDARLMLAVNYLFSGQAEAAAAILKAPEGAALLREDGVQILLQEASPK